MNEQNEWIRIEDIDPDGPLGNLRDDAPEQACTGCGRHTWSKTEFNAPCNFPQPDGTRCVGVFKSMTTPLECAEQRNMRKFVGQQFVRFYDENSRTTGLYQQVGYVWTDADGNRVGKWDWELMP